MKVMCIATTWTKSSGPECGNNSNGPSYCETVIVVKELINLGMAGYILSGYGESNLYDKNFFIPLSSIDETELVNQRENVNV